MTIGQRGGRYTEADDSNMQIEQVGHKFFLDKWVGDGWKNISVHKSYDDALKAREELAAIAALRERLGERHGTEGMKERPIIFSGTAHLAGVGNGAANTPWASGCGDAALSAQECREKCDEQLHNTGR